jgi:hypothetical protein
MSLDKLSLTNYTAIAILERMGIDPTREQITIIESLVLMASHPKKVKSRTIKRCVGEDTLAYLFLYLKNKDLST